MLKKLFSYVSFRVKRDIYVMRTRLALFGFNLTPDLMVLSPLRNFMLLCGGASVSLFHSYIRSPFYCADLSNIEIGKGVFVNMGCRFEGATQIKIGDRCQIAPFVSIETVNHLVDGDEVLPVSIGSGVWLGTKCIVLPGVEISDGVIVGAGAVVTKNIPPGETWVGVPARKIR